MRGRSLDSATADLDRFSRLSEKLYSLSRRLGTKKDSQDLRTNLFRVQKEARELEKRVESQFRQLAQTIRTRDKDYTQLKHLEQSFKKTLQTYNGAQKLIEKFKDDLKRKHSHVDESHLLNFKATQTHTDAENPSASLLQEQEQEQQMAQFRPVSDMLVGDVSYIEEKHEGIMAIETETIAVLELFEDLQHVVESATPHLEKSAENTSSTVVHMTESNVELKTAEEYQKRSRRKQCCLLVMLLFVAIMIAFGFVVLG